MKRKSRLRRVQNSTAPKASDPGRTVSALNWVAIIASFIAIVYIAATRVVTNQVPTNTATFSVCRYHRAVHQTVFGIEVQQRAAESQRCDPTQR